VNQPATNQWQGNVRISKKAPSLTPNLSILQATSRQTAGLLAESPVNVNRAEPIADGMRFFMLFLLRFSDEFPVYLLADFTFTGKFSSANSS
jgi:hypothetical protein